jgi:hypothetical protein
MRLKGNLFLRTSVWLVASIGALTLGVTAFTYSGSTNRETMGTFARGFFVQLWKDSHARATAKNTCPSATPEGRVIQ